MTVPLQSLIAGPSICLFRQKGSAQPDSPAVDIADESDGISVGERRANARAAQAGCRAGHDRGEFGGVLVIDYFGAAFQYARRRAH